MRSEWVIPFPSHHGLGVKGHVRFITGTTFLDAVPQQLLNIVNRR